MQIDDVFYLQLRAWTGAGEMVPWVQGGRDSLYFLARNRIGTFLCRFRVVRALSPGPIQRRTHHWRLMINVIGNAALILLLLLLLLLMVAVVVV